MTASPRQLFGDTSNDTWLWLNTAGRERIPGLAGQLPGVPTEASQLSFNLLGGQAALTEAFRIYELYRRLYTDHGGSFDESTSVLDFGCGWGRMIRFFLRDVEPANLWGIDPSPSAIRNCQETNPWCQFRQSDPFPPSSFAADTFDLIYCWSVFSHLAEDCHLQWLAEFRKILKPGGLLVASTLRRDFIQACATARIAAPQGDARSARFQQQIALAFRNTAEAEANYDAGRFCFSNVGEETGDFGMTCISEAYVRRQWATHLDLADFVDDSNFTQNVIVMRRAQA